MQNCHLGRQFAKGLSGMGGLGLRGAKSHAPGAHAAYVLSSLYLIASLLGRPVQQGGEGAAEVRPSTEEEGDVQQGGEDAAEVRPGTEAEGNVQQGGEGAAEVRPGTEAEGNVQQGGEVAA